MTNSPEPGPFSSDPPSARLTWRWRLEDAQGGEIENSHAEAAFPSQSDAESWIGEVWRELSEAGVAAVTLFEADRMVYGPMSLSA